VNVLSVLVSTILAAIDAGDWMIKVLAVCVLVGAWRAVTVVS
jgi:hypothetical protein